MNGREVNAGVANGMEMNQKQETFVQKKKKLFCEQTQLIDTGTFSEGQL